MDSFTSDSLSGALSIINVFEEPIALPLFCARAEEAAFSIACLVRRRSASLTGKKS